MNKEFLSTSIPYVNAAPHIGFALELVIADTLSRYRRQHASDVYFLTGTDDNSLKNALAAEAAGVSTEEWIAHNGNEFEALSGALNIGNNDFIRTSKDPRHAPSVVKLWKACYARGDIYTADYEGLYCVGCEQFYTSDELTGGLCPDHETEPEPISERNYFFRLSRYQDALIQLIKRDLLVVRPEHRKNEMLSFLQQPLKDLSISRSTQRAHGWGIPVPDDPTQVIYVWFDALANYVSALGYASDSDRYLAHWQNAERITHIVGKGVTRFHAIYWPAILMSAGIRLPSEILVHGYITIDNRKISKSLGNVITPTAAAQKHGVDALRYYLLSDIGSHRDGQFSWTQFADAYEHRLANQLGNLVSRTVGLAKKHGRPTRKTNHLTEHLEEKIASHMDNFAVHQALKAIWTVIESANTYISANEPWRLAKAGNLEGFFVVLGELYGTLFTISHELAPFLPDTSKRIAHTLQESETDPLFPR